MSNFKCLVIRVWYVHSQAPDGTLDLLLIASLALYLTRPAPLVASETVFQCSTWNTRVVRVKNTQWAYGHAPNYLVVQSLASWKPGILGLLEHDKLTLQRLDQLVLPPHSKRPPDIVPRLVLPDPPKQEQLATNL
jgi:hypothetical protein